MWPVANWRSVGGPLVIMVTVERLLHIVTIATVKPLNYELMWLPWLSCLVWTMVTMVTIATHNTNVSERSCEGCFYFKGCGYCVVVLWLVPVWYLSRVLWRLCGGDVKPLLCGSVPQQGWDVWPKCWVTECSSYLLQQSECQVYLLVKSLIFQKIPWHSHLDKICFVALSTW